MPSLDLPQKRKMESPSSPAQSSGDPFQEVVETMQSKGRLLIFVPGNCEHIHGVSFMTTSTWSSEQLECPGAGKSKGLGKAKDVGKNPEESLRSIAAMQANQFTKGKDKGKLVKGEDPTVLKGKGMGKGLSEDPTLFKGKSKGKSKEASEDIDTLFKGKGKGKSKEPSEDRTLFTGKGKGKSKEPSEDPTLSKGKAMGKGTESGGSLETLPMLPTTPKMLPSPVDHGKGSPAPHNKGNEKGSALLDQPEGNNKGKKGETSKGKIIEKGTVKGDGKKGFTAIKGKTAVKGKDKDMGKGAEKGESTPATPPVTPTRRLALPGTLAKAKGLNAMAGSTTPQSTPSTTDEGKGKGKEKGGEDGKGKANAAETVGEAVVDQVSPGEWLVSLGGVEKNSRTACAQLYNIHFKQFFCWTNHGCSQELPKSRLISINMANSLHVQTSLVKCIITKNHKGQRSICWSLTYRYTFGIALPLQLRPSNLNRGLSSVSIDQILTSGQNGKRIKALTEEQKEAIRSLQTPQDLPYPERKRQFAALGRRLERPCPPGVLQKWEAAKTDDEKLLILNDDLWGHDFAFCWLQLTHLFLKPRASIWGLNS